MRARNHQIATRIEEFMDLTEVYVKNGEPTVTYVQPKSFFRLKQALKAPGRGIIIEGPSGIGKTTVLKRCLESLGKDVNVPILTPRNSEGVKKISEYVDKDLQSDIIIDDFHRLDQELKDRIADIQKHRADEGRKTGKIVLIGINEAGESLVAGSGDLVPRIDVIVVEREDDESVRKLVELGEDELNITFECREDIVRKAAGSFHVAQMICYELCIQAEIEETQVEVTEVRVPLSSAMNQLLTDYNKQFGKMLRNFSHGHKFRPSGNAPYYHVLRWLGESELDSINLGVEIRNHKALKASVNQIVKKNFFEEFCNRPGYREYFHFDPETLIFAAEDPFLRFYMKNLNWDAFKVEAGFAEKDIVYEYDFALTFAGSDCRNIAKRIQAKLLESGASVFLDEDCQDEILGKTIADIIPEKYSGSKCNIVVPIVDNNYGTSTWVKDEIVSYRERIGSGHVVPIWVDREGSSGFDSLQEVGGINIRANGVAAEELQIVIDRSVGSLISKLDSSDS